MTLRTNARVAGAAFLAYIAIGITQMVLSRPLATSAGTAARLALLADHLSVVRINLLLTLLTAGIALALAVSLYALTRDVDHDVARFSLLCRVGEGLFGACGPLITLGLIGLATPRAADAAQASATEVLATSLFRMRASNVELGAMLFAWGSTGFSWLLLRGALIPLPLAWLGVFASLLLAIALPLELVGIMSGPMLQALWLPAAAFEIPLGVWLLAKGVRGRDAP